jgi:hypothetical protein
MTIEQESVRALGKAVRVVLSAGDEIPVEMQAALLRLAVAQWPEPRASSSSLCANKEMMEHANGNEEQAEEARLAG